MKIQKLKKYLMLKEKNLYETIEKDLERLGYCPVVKYEKKTYRYKKFSKNNNKNKQTKKPLPDDVVVCEEPQYLYAEGGDPTVLLVAHTDTVHTREPSQVFFDQEAGVMWSPEGLGADDRAGVFAVMELAVRFNVSVLLCSGEESGGIGVSSFCEDFLENPGYKMVIELDRCGIDDCVFYDNESKDFHNWVETFGFKKTWGSFSDISVLGPAWRVNAVNLSIGYEEEHTSKEHLFIRELYTTIEKVSNMLSSYIPEFEYSECRWGYGYGGRGDSSYIRTKTYMNNLDRDTCDFCGTFKVLREVERSYLCDECYDANAFICLACGIPAFRDFSTEGTEDEGLCESCVGKYFVKDASGEGERKLLTPDVTSGKKERVERAYCDACGSLKGVWPHNENYLCRDCMDFRWVDANNKDDDAVLEDKVTENKKDDGGCAK